jgi:hypothetical protein
VSIQKTEPRTKVSDEVRWLACATGCLTALTGFYFGVLVLVPDFLIVIGSLAAGYFPRAGKYLIWFGAVTLSLLGIPIVVWMLLNALHPGTDSRVILGALSSVALLLLFDVALVMEMLKTRRSSMMEAKIPSPRSGKFLFWIAAAILNLGFLPISVLCISTYRGEGGRGVLFSLALGLHVILFDMVLAVNAFRMRRSRHGEKTNINPSSK